MNKFVISEEIAECFEKAQAKYDTMPLEDQKMMDSVAAVFMKCGYTTGIKNTLKVVVPFGLLTGLGICAYKCYKIKKSQLDQK